MVRGGGGGGRVVCGAGRAEAGRARREAAAPQTVRRWARRGARGAARRRDAARLSVETRGPPALAVRTAAHPPRALDISPLQNLQFTIFDPLATIQPKYEIRSVLAYYNVPLLLLSDGSARVTR